jgi:hypothetical protein
MFLEYFKIDSVRTDFHNFGCQIEIGRILTKSDAKMIHT